MKRSDLFAEIKRGPRPGFWRISVYGPYDTVVVRVASWDNIFFPRSLKWVERKAERMIESVYQEQERSEWSRVVKLEEG